MTTQLRSARLTGERRPSIGFMALFGLAVAFVVYGIFAPRWLEPVYERLGTDIFTEGSAAEAIGFQVWLFAAPLAVILAIVGGVLRARSNRARAWLFGLGGLALVIVPVIISGIIGRTYGWLFGTGGTLIAVFALATIWYWSAGRPDLAPRRRLASDLRMAGYMGFAFAAWFTCGVFALPVYALDVDRMVAMDVGGLMLGMAYAMMAFFIAGWAFTFAAQVLDRNDRTSQETPIERTEARQPVATR